MGGEWGCEECGRKKMKEKGEFRFHDILPHPKIPPNLNVSQGDLLSPLSTFFSSFFSLLFFFSVHLVPFVVPLSRFILRISIRRRAAQTGLVSFRGSRRLGLTWLMVGA